MIRILAVVLLVICAIPARSAEILGTQPSYLSEVAKSFANDHAVLRRIWVPGLEEGYVPQGLAIVGRHIFVSAYQGTAKPDQATCRVFRVEVETGKAAGSFDLPSQCGHSGGVADVGGGLIVVSDTRYLWRIDAEKALAAGKAEGALRGSVQLAGELVGSFLSFDGKDIWIGTYTVRAEAAKAKLHRLPMRVFDEFDGRGIDESQALETLPSPPLGQGMALKGNEIWIASSSSQIGWLHRLERATGKVIARYDTIIGIEGIAFDSQGRLWAVSEAGARKYLQWKLHFPLIFEIDAAKLQ
jgi:hypothetical protein